jgi:hypothetical protein
VQLLTNFDCTQSVSQCRLLTKIHLRWKNLTLCAIITAGLWLTACGGGAASGPVGAVQAYLNAIGKLDVKAALDLTCTSQKEAVSAALSFLTGTGSDFSALANLYSFDFSKITFQESNNDGKSATLHLGGVLTLKALGLEQTQNMNQDVPVVNEAGQWKICGAIDLTKP